MATNQSTNEYIFKNEKLIEEVRNFKFLYDTNDENYLKIKLTDCVWREIAKNLGLKNGNEARTAWKKLRNCHRDALRRQKKCMRSGIPASEIQPWRYQKQMNFLLPFMPHHNQEGNIDADSDIDNNEENSQAGQMQEAEDHEQQTLDYSDASQQMISETTECKQEPGCSSVTKNKNSSKKSVTEDQSMSPTRKVKRAKKIQKDDVSVSINQFPSNYENMDEDRIYEIKELEGSSKPPDDHLYHFFMSMYYTTKSMPLAYQYTVRNDVYNVVSKAEAKCFGFQSYQYQPRPTSSLYLYRKSESPQNCASYSSPPSPIPSPNCDNKNNLKLGHEFVTVLLENNEGETREQSQSNSNNLV
ncbi:unnamed protein product [Callosobruchus maculatus]|uniref:MADF domain-containing protein n=1 Tax=Callosobruchus maculatus TaxID=64391 RepID=A0A653DM94_CALMS|nr:unnamed protein product [Callosobruchus maculatus]